MPSSTSHSRRSVAGRDVATAARRPPRPGGSRTRAADDRADLCEVQVVDRERIVRARAALPQTETLAALAELLRAIGDRTRLQIVCALATERVGELCVCDLATLVGVSDSGVSHSLRTLRQLGLVQYRKVGKIAYYRLDDDHVGGLVREGIRHLERQTR